MKENRTEFRRMYTHKLDPRLYAMTHYPLKQLESLKRKEHKQFVSQMERAEKLHLEIINTKPKEKKEKLEVKYDKLAAQFTVPFTFGLYFPKHSRKEVSHFTKLREPFISCLVKSQANIRDLKKVGIEVRNQAGDIFTANVPYKSLKRLVKMPMIEYIELGRPNFPDLGQGIPYAQLDTLHNATPAITGNGVIVGIVDTHMDVYHVDFRNNDGAGGDGLGSTRILFLWNQRLTPQGTEAGPPVAPTLPGFNFSGGSSYGVEYSQANINTELNNYAPPTAPTPQAAYQTVRHGYTSTASLLSSHGTHVAGCAVGNGRSGNNGAAPNADIIYVHLSGTTNYVGSDSASLADAYSYIYARAAALGQPCVVNRSGSDNMGPHDGTTLGEQFLDNLLLVPSRVSIFAAGNTDNKSSHTQNTVTTGATTNLTLTYQGVDTDLDGTLDAFPTSSDQIELWYDGHDTISVTVTAPDGTAVGPLPPGSNSPVTTLTDNTTMQIIHGALDPRNSDNVITIFLARGTASSLQVGNYTIALTGTNIINGFIAGWIERNNRGFRTWANVITGNMTIASPGTSLRCIAVGSHDTTAGSPNPASSSSAGPTRDGRIKPDISANGLSVVAARSEDKNSTTPGALTVSKSGTSMAAPITAGAVACLFECLGAGLTWANVKQLLWNSAGIPTVGVPDNKFGFGFLQMGTPCTDPTPDVDVWLRDHTSDTGVEPFTGGVSWLSPDIEVLDLAGNPVANPTHDPTSYISNRVRVTVRNRGSQTANNVQVFLHWADPGTNLPYPSEWQTVGIYTGNAPNFVNQSNMVVVPQLAAGATQQVEFGWAPPAPGSNVRGDDHFCLLVRLETEIDPSNIGTGGWDVIRESNNIALRNTHIIELSDDGDSDFFFTGTDDTDTLWLDTENLNAEIMLIFPVEGLKFRDGGLINKIGNRVPFGEDCKKDPLRNVKRTLKQKQIELYTGITGARVLHINNGLVSIIKDPEQRLHIPEMTVKEGVKMPIHLQFKKPALKGRTGAIHIGQFTGGQHAGGVTVEVWKKVPKPKKLRALRKGNKLIIQKTR